MGIVPNPATVPATSTLGDWYANTLSRGSQRYILAVAEKSLLPVIIPLREAKTAPVRLATAVKQALFDLGVSSLKIESELSAMRDFSIARTSSKAVLGVMTNMAYVLDYYDYDWPIDELCQMLREMPCKPIAHETPERMTRKLLA